MASIRTAGLTRELGDLRTVDAIDLDLFGVGWVRRSEGAGECTAIGTLLVAVA